MPAAMTDHDALLAAVLADPEDDAPRLVLADWFEENGQEERGEFVRVQCRIAEYERQAGGDPRRKFGWPVHYETLRHRERELWRNGCVEWFCVEWFEHLKDTPVCVALTEGDACDKPTHGLPVRGFIGELRTTLAGFLGGPCSHCRGRGSNAIPSDWQDWSQCKQCKGTGRTLGAVGVFAREPVTAVRLTCREPYPILDGSGLWAWGNVLPDRNGAEGLPDEIYGLLAGFVRGGGLAKHYPSRDAALAALSRAATNYGRVAAGLSPLPPTPGAAA